MLKLCSKVLKKTRFIIPIEGSDLKWEIDFFKGKNDGLIMAEIEVSYTGFKFDKPIWLGEDVSENPNYTNVSLAIEV